MRLLPAIAIALFATDAAAIQYEAEIRISTEQDLRDLYERQEIDQDALETLVDLFREGVELNSASSEELYTLPNLTYAHVEAILLYRKQVGVIRDAAELVTVGAVPLELFEQISPFVYVAPPQALPLAGSLRAVTAYTLG